jgi:hypothetical protein
LTFNIRPATVNRGKAIFSWCILIGSSAAWNQYSHLGGIILLDLTRTSIGDTCVTPGKPLCEMIPACSWTPDIYIRGIAGIISLLEPTSIEHNGADWSDHWLHLRSAVDIGTIRLK